MRLVCALLCAALMVSCAPSPSAPPEEVKLPPSPLPEFDLPDGGPTDEAELSRVERTFEYDPQDAPSVLEPVLVLPVVRVVDVVAAVRPPAYRNPHYPPICRRHTRRGDLPVAERLESRTEARARARAMARAGELDEVLIFARMAYGEENTPSRNNSDGYHALLAVIDFQRGRMSRVEMMVNYAPRRVFPQREGRAAARQQWLAELQLTGERPPSWPAHRGARWGIYPPWRTYGCPRWLAAIDEVRSLLLRYADRRVGRGPCEEVPHHWGGSRDDRSDDCHWRVIDCGNTADTFWVVDAICPDEEVVASL